MTNSSSTTINPDNDPAYQPSSGSRVGRIIAIVAVVAAFIALLIVSLSMNSAPADQVWNSAMSIGSSDSNRLYVMYTDLACPYCDVFSRATLENWDEFLAYLDEHHILYEIRLTDSLYEGNGIQMSRDSAEAAYCASYEDKFWDYYHNAIQSLWDDYHSKGIGSNKSAPQITGMPDDYWLTIGHEVGLGASFDECVANHSSLDDVIAKTTKALAVSDGMPTFKFGKFSTAGFSDTWGWDYVKRYLDAGL